MPKKKGGKKGAKIVDGIVTSEMSRDQLAGHVRRIQVELDREREERNFFMLEREKLFALWNIALEQLHAQKTQTLLAIEKMAENDEDKQKEVLMYKQKLRHLLSEQGKRIQEGRLSNLKKLRKAQDDMLSMQRTLKESVDQKSNELRLAQTAMHQLFRQLKVENAKNISEVRNELNLEIGRLERDFTRLSLEREKRDEIAMENERELVKNKHLEHVEQIKGIHKTETEKTKSYFHELITNNLAALVALQDEVKEMKDTERKLLLKVNKTHQEMEIYAEALNREREARKKLAERDTKLKKGISKELKKMRSIQQTKDRYTRSVEVANEALIQKMEKMDGECRAFKQTLGKAILDMQQEASMKKMILELKLKAASQQNKKQILMKQNNGKEEQKDVKGY